MRSTFFLNQPFPASPLAIRVAHVLERLTGAEARAVRRLDVDLCSGGRIASFASRAEVQFEGAKAREVDSLSVGNLLRINQMRLGIDWGSDSAMSCKSSNSFVSLYSQLQ